MTSPDPDVIFHIAQPDDLQEAQSSGRYVCDSLASEGFIHCCLESQLQGVVERYYQGVDGVIVLKLNPTKLQEELRYENTVGGTEAFPHIYGPINLDAIVSQAPL